MFKIEGTTLHLSRGDAATFMVKFRDVSTGGYYTFQPGDVLRFTITKNFKQLEYTLQKEIKVSEETDVVTIELTSEETLIGDPISRPVNYQYDLVLNDIHSVICYNDSGAPTLTLYPRSSDTID